MNSLPRLMPDEAKLQEMKREHDLGENVDVDLYEATRRRHNSAVDSHNATCGGVQLIASTLTNLCSVPPMK